VPLAERAVCADSGRMGVSVPSNALTVRVLPSVEAATEVALDELHAATRGPGRPLISFATGSTFTALLQWLHGEVVAGRLHLDRLVATHLDEYVGCAPDQRGGMVHELCTTCPSLATLLRRGLFVPVPADGDPARLRQHEQRLAHLGGVQLQFLGIGRNGHIAFNEPGTDFDVGFHVAELATTTRDDARARFLPGEAPPCAVTAGIASILASRRIVVCAFGRRKAPAVRAMLEGEVDSSCPATALRTHGNVLVLLDRDAAAGLRRGREFAV